VNSLILIGDARQRLAELPAGSARTCVTSPPYFGLRDYGTASWEGGDPECEHRVGRATRGGLTGKQASNTGSFGDEAVKECPHCGAKRVDSQIGLEETPDAYVAEMVALFREVWRVLADDGTLWLNIGDSYAGNNSGKGLKPKDLIGIPWRVAFAFQADGWYLRSDIIWHKPNPMPESVTDRPTKSHEYLFLLTKSPRYYYDHEAIKEDAVTNIGEAKIRFGGSKYGDSDDPKHATKSGNVYEPSGKRNKRDVWTINTKPFKGAHFAVMPEALVEPCVLAGSAEGDTVLDPFTGSGTVAVVANRHGRNFVGTELNAEYAQIAYDRITGDAPMLNIVSVTPSH